VINLLKVKFHEIKVNRGKKHQYLGMLFDFSNTGRVNIKMTGYIEDILEKMGVSGTATTLLTETSSPSMMQRWPLMKRVKRRCALWFINSSMCALGWSLRLSLQ
jgi:hypothetical protein